MTDLETADEAVASGKAGKVQVGKAAKPNRYDALDKSQPYGTVFSATGHHPAAHFQNGRHYDAQGKRVVLPGDKENERLSDAAEKQRRQEQASFLRRKADAVEAGEDPDAVTGDEEADGVNLALWGAGKARYRFGAVREAIQARYSRSVHNEGEAKDFLAEQGIISRAQVRQGNRPENKRG